ncbi:DUF3820 family protein [Verrucomicrobiales bacterium]|jgi:uncharacterized protein|nr:DUF3820 family protein [Verrucomicrobiales bacterium]|tara:strand:- start:276 stop:542 length:267 start_codon:yes stop_codon:yes gene_type:complete
MSDRGEEIDLGAVMRQELAENLADLELYRMPFGRYQNRFIHTLPYEYLHWFLEKGGGFPTGRLGELMEFVYHTKASGSEIVFSKLRRH